MSINSRRKTVLRTALVISASLSALAMPAYAQEDEADDGDIIVTAQFREQNLQDTPLSITAVNAELLESRSQTDLSQIARQAPNVTLNAMGGAYGSSLGASIRGIGQFDFNPAYEPGVGMYVDDVYYPTLTGGIFDLLDLDRVEILRGPQGTLTGRNSIGGAIKLFSKKPSDENVGSITATYGARKRMELRGSANFVLADGLYARVSGVYKQQDGYVKQLDYGCARPGNPEGVGPFASTPANCVMSKLGEINYAGLRGSLRYNPGDTFDLVLTADYTREDRANAAEVVTRTIAATTNARCGRYCTFASFYLPAGGQVAAGYFQPNTTKFDGWGVSANATFNLSDSINIQSITAYRDYRQIWGTDDDYTPFAGRGAGGLNDLKFWFFSQELRLNGKVGDSADFTVGAYYSDQRSVYFTRQDIRYIAPGLNFQFQGNDPVNADSKAVFASVEVRPTEALTLNGGLRYTDEHKDYTFVRQNYNGTRSIFLGALDGVKATYDGNKLDWRLAANYRFSPAFMAYASASTGFKGGGVTARPFDAAQALNGSFDPETVTAFEIGFKSDLLDRKLRLNVSAFINDYKDIQLPLISCASLGSNAPCGARQNAGSGKIKGFEAELNASPVEGLDIDASLAHLYGSYSKIDPRVGNAILLTDPIVSPKWKWSAGIQYKTGWIGGDWTVTPRFDISGVGKQSQGRVAAGGPIEFEPSYSIANGRITWRNKDEDLAVSVEVQNIFNEYYNPFRFAAVFAFSGTIYSQVGRPREWAITVNKKF